MRPRKRNNRSLPPNLYVSHKGSAFYYRYRNPQTGKEHSLGKNRVDAITAANRLNGMLQPPSNIVAEIMGKESLRSWLERYEQIITERAYSPTTLRQKLWQIATIKEEMGSRLLHDITTRHIAEFLDKRPPRMSNTFRSSLLDIFREAIAKGLRETNPVEPTRNKKYEVQRQRLSADGFWAIHSAARRRPWLVRAMELSLVTLQRREDVAAMKFTDIEDGRLHVIQQKTGAPLRIAVVGELDTSSSDAATVCCPAFWSTMTSPGRFASPATRYTLTP